MTDFLVRHFVKNYQEVENAAVRTAYGVFASIVGILCNTFLFLVKFVIGLVLNSVSVTADASHQNCLSRHNIANRPSLDRTERNHILIFWLHLRTDQPLDR